MRTYWLVALLLAPLGAVTAAAYGQDVQGDVNGDGVVDIKDALRLCRVIQGKVTATDRDRNLGDVYPLTGDANRPFGNGKLDRDDVQQVLRMLVGAAPRGEVTGAFDPPEVDAFKPMSGPVGTRMVIEGRNFVGTGAGEKAMTVLFGDLPAASLKPISSTQVEAVVPAGFTGGRITVLAPGGEGVSMLQFTVTRSMTGALHLPTGLDAAATDVVSISGDGTVDSQGNFTVPSGRSVPLW